MQIKTFDFEISNSSKFAGNKYNEDYLNQLNRSITAPIEIDTMLSSWIESTNAEVIDIKVNTYVAKHSSNGIDSVRVRYTILYNEER